MSAVLFTYFSVLIGEKGKRKPLVFVKLLMGLFRIRTNAKDRRTYYKAKLKIAGIIVSISREEY